MFNELIAKVRLKEGDKLEHSVLWKIQELEIPAEVHNGRSAPVNDNFTLRASLFVDPSIVSAEVRTLQLKTKDQFSSTNQLNLILFLFI